VKNWRELTFFWLHSILLTADGVGWLSIDITPQEVRTTTTTTCNCTNSRPYTGDELEHIWMGFPSGSTVSSMFLCCFSRKIKCRFDCRKDDPDFWGWRACAWLNANLSAWLCVSNNQSALNSARRPTNGRRIMLVRNEGCRCRLWMPLAMRSQARQRPKSRRFWKGEQ
jgi:hypothetical protein